MSETTSAQRRRQRALLASTLAVACASCGQADHRPTASSFPHVESFGGPVLAAPVFVPVFFAGDDPGVISALEDFTQRIGASSYWKETTREYGVGAAISATPIHLAEATPAQKHAWFGLAAP